MSAWRVPDWLPPGRQVTPDPRYARGEPVSQPVLWVSDAPVPDVGAWWARLRLAHPETGLWPLLLTPLTGAFVGEGRPWHSGELAPVPAEVVDGLDVEEVLAHRWEAVDDLDGLPSRSRPGLAAPGVPDVDPDRHAEVLLGTRDGVAAVTGTDTDPYLGLVPAPDGAGAIAAGGWMAEAGAEEAAVVVRSWQRRFGVRLCALGFDSLGVSVAWPPRTVEHARQVAAEHYAFCPDLIDQAVVASSFAEYATQLVDAESWWFWWD